MKENSNSGLAVQETVTILAALAHEARLGVFRLLVQTGPGGLAASRIAEQIGMPSSSLSFHLKELAHAGLVSARQDGRFIYYAVRFERMNDLLAFLTDNCCGGTPCLPACQP
jgi:DNA-binding transcriptional ArsR family regulator